MAEKVTVQDVRFIQPLSMFDFFFLKILSGIAGSSYAIDYLNKSAAYLSCTLVVR